MKIGFAIQSNKGWDSVLSEKFGRAEAFIVYDEENDAFAFKSNEGNASAGHGAGIQASQTILSISAEVVLTGGNYGPKAFDVLKAAKVKSYSQIGEITIREAYENFKAGKYTETLESDK